MHSTALWGTILVIIVIIVAAFLVMRQPDNSAISPVTTSMEEEGEAEQLNLEVPSTVGDAVTTESPAATPDQTSETETVSADVITITDTGFTPAALTVPVNTTVTFTNNGQGAHWPASAPHPTHTGLPGFDAKRGLATGESYSYTFTKVGTWPFHDHLNPRLTGSVTVE